MDMFIKILFLVIFFAVMIGVGIYCRNQATNVNGFVLGNRSVGPWLTAFAFGTSYFSAVIFVGYAGQFGWRFGLASTWIGLGNAFIGSLLAWNVLGRRTRVMTQHLDSATMPDFFAKRYDSKALKIAAAIIIFIFLIPYTASLYNGLSRLFEMAFHIPYTYCVIAMAVLTGVYVVLGGYMATAINDFIQGIIMLVGIVAVIAAVMQINGGLTETIAKLSQESVTTAGGNQFNGVFTSFFGPDIFGLIGVIGFGVLYVLISQSAMNRVIKTFNEFKGLFSGDINHFGAGRGYIWTYCIESIPKNWVWGVGLDNLYYCYTSSSHWMEAMYYSNRAHNVYLHVLTTQGVFGFANYMALLITSCVMAVRRILKTDDEFLT